eukprot:6189425-Pleurochrysis_carterae.AAC.2
MHPPLHCSLHAYSRYILHLSHRAQRLCAIAQSARPESAHFAAHISPRQRRAPRAPPLTFSASPSDAALRSHTCIGAATKLRAAAFAALIAAMFRVATHTIKCTKSALQAVRAAAAATEPTVGSLPWSLRDTALSPGSLATTRSSPTKRLSNSRKGNHQSYFFFFVAAACLLAACAATFVFSVAYMQPPLIYLLLHWLHRPSCGFMNRRVQLQHTLYGLIVNEAAGMVDAAIGLRPLPTPAQLFANLRRRKSS